MSPSVEEQKKLKLDSSTEQNTPNKEEVKRDGSLSEGSDDSEDLYIKAFGKPSPVLSDDEKVVEEDAAKQKVVKDICTQIDKTQISPSTDQPSVSSPPPPSPELDKPVPSPQSKPDVDTDIEMSDAVIKPDEFITTIDETRKISVHEYKKYFEGKKVQNLPQQAIQSKTTKPGKVQKQVSVKDDMVNVLFSAAVPAICLKNEENWHVRMIFLCEETKERLDVQTHNYQNLENNIYMLETRAQLPRGLITRKQILYIYYVELTSKADETKNTVQKVYEQYFTELELVRHLNIELKIDEHLVDKHHLHSQFENGQNIKMQTAEAVQTDLYQYDGLVLFGNVLE